MPLFSPCEQIYVGQTSQELRKHIQKHLSMIALSHRYAQDRKTLTSIADHFLKIHGGKSRGLTVVGLDHVFPNIRGENLTSILLRKESQWIYRLDTGVPRGLNQELIFTGFLGWYIPAFPLPLLFWFLPLIWEPFPSPKIPPPPFFSHLPIVFPIPALSVSYSHLGLNFVLHSFGLFFIYDFLLSPDPSISFFSPPL